MPSLERPERNPAQQHVLDTLGASPDDRPSFADDIGPRLRADLENQLVPILDELGPDEDLVVTKHLLASIHGCEVKLLAEGDDEFVVTVPVARGTVAHKAIELGIHWSGEPAPLDLVDEAIARLTQTDHWLSDWLQTAPLADRAELRSSAGDRVSKFFECFPKLEARWRPVTESSLWADLLDGRVQLRGKVDLTVGSPTGSRAGKVIIDLKTGATNTTHRDDLRFYALVETIRLGVPPRLIASYYLDSATLHTESVTEALLESTVARTVDGARRYAALGNGSVAPVKRPSVVCRWCPVSTPATKVGPTSTPTTSPSTSEAMRTSRRVSPSTSPPDQRPGPGSVGEGPGYHSARARGRSGPDVPGRTSAACSRPREPEDGEERAALVHLPVPARHDTPSSVDPARMGDVDEWGRSENLRALARKLYAPLYEKWFRVEWEGLDKIPTEGGALIVANHAAAIPSDAPAIMHGIETELERAVYGLADQYFKRLPFIGTMWSRTGGVVAHPDNAYRLLREQQQLVLVFPEGSKGPGKTYNERYRLRRFGRGGFVEIAMRAGVPIVPIAVIGAEESMPILFKLPAVSKALGLPYAPITANMLLLGPLGTVGYFPAKFKLRVLDPVTFDDIEPDQLRYSRSRIMDESEAIRQRIQGELYDMLRHRRSIWFG